MTGSIFKYGFKSLFVIVYSHQIRFMYWWRKSKRRMTPFRKLMLYRYSRKYGLEIASRATIGDGLYLGHPYNITVASGAVIVELSRNVQSEKTQNLG